MQCHRWQLLRHCGLNEMEITPKVFYLFHLNVSQSDNIYHGWLEEWQANVMIAFVQLSPIAYHVT